MFLTIGEKLKHCRKEFKIKQAQFQKYGFSPAYISMIEKESRKAPRETIEQIYHALLELTSGEVQQLYSLDKFMMSDKEQAILWLKENDTIETGLSNYEQYKDICLKYDLKEQIRSLEEKIAYHYQRMHQYSQSNQHFLSCIYYSQKESDYLSIYYRRIAKNYLKSGSYHEAMMNLKLSSLYSCEKDENLGYKNDYDLARINYFLNDLNQSHVYLDKLLNECQNSQILGATVLLKEVVLKKEGKYLEAINLLKNFIKDEMYLPYMKYAYHNLGCNLKEQGLYEEAIFTVQNSFNYLETESERALALFLLGDIYYDLKDFSQAQLNYDQSRTVLLKESNFYNTKTVVQKLVCLYLKQADINALEELIKEVEEVCDIIQRKELINIIKNEIYRNLLEEKIELSPFIEKYLA